MAENIDMSNWDLNYSDIMEIFKNNLKIENTLKSIQSIFLNTRFSSKINYKPYFQRNYVWDKEKATYFIESILLGTEIPPLVLFKGPTGNASSIEVIDGRQRYETILKFLNNDNELIENGLHQLSSFANCHYFDLDEEVSDRFNNTKIRILQYSVTNEPSLTAEKEDKIKKEIFKRYNSGITPLKREENARAEYYDDPITTTIRKFFGDNPNYLRITEDLFLSKSKLNLQERDRLNVVLERVRSIFALTKIPIYSYAKSAHRYDIIRHFYNSEISHYEPNRILNRLTDVLTILSKIRNSMDATNAVNNVLFYETLCWGLLILLDYGIVIDDDHVKEISKDILNSSAVEVFWTGITNANKHQDAIFESTGSHYRNATMDRYRFISNYLSNKFAVDFSGKIKDAPVFTKIMGSKPQSEQVKLLGLIKPDPVSVAIDDILVEMSQEKFLVRPDYQRSEVMNIQKSSYLLESIMLGITIPPIYIYKRKDKIKEVIDGQQRILSILGFLGKTYIDENGHQQLSSKHKFKLSGLKILKELNGLNVDAVQEKYPQYIDNILDFAINVVEIDAAQNPEFNSIDLFLRLNTKPFPIKPNSFEMWNAYVAKGLTQKIKDLASQHEGKLFRSKDTRMSNEELITALAYLHYQYNFKKANYKDLLTIYLRDAHVCARISSKDRITKMLEGLSAEGSSNFELSINAVAEFLAKLCLLVGEDGKALPVLLATNHKTDQNFYFLWMILEKLSLEYISQNKTEVFHEVQKRFERISSAPEALEIIEFIDQLSINK